MTTPFATALATQLTDANTEIPLEILGTMQVAVSIVGADRTLKAGNSCFAEFYRLPEELVRPGTPMLDIFGFLVARDGLGEGTVDERIARAMAGIDEPVFHDHGIGGYRTFEVRSQVLDDGSILRLHREVTQRLQAESAALEATRRLTHGLERISEGFALYNERGQIVIANSRMRELYPDLAEHLVPGASFRDMVAAAEATRAFVVETVDTASWAADCLTAFEAERRSWEWQLSDGTWVAVDLHATDDGGRVAIHTDVTAAKAASAALTAANEELESRVAQRTAQLTTANRDLQIEIAERRKAEERLAHLAHHDSLTGLANRNLFNDRLLRGMARCRRRAEQLAVLFLDLDGFKEVNDRLGHEFGDWILVQVAERLGHCIRESDTLARMGGDEFIGILENVPQIEDALVVARRMLAALTEPFEWNGNQASLGVSIGIAVYPGDGHEPEELVRHADKALYVAKQKGKNTYRLYTSDMG